MTYAYKINRLYLPASGTTRQVASTKVVKTVMPRSAALQSGRSPKVVALFSATNFSSYIIELLQLQDAIQIQWNYAWIHYNIAKRSHLMI